MNRIKLENSISNSMSKIAPAWPLKNFVAVNPFLGFLENEFGDTAQFLAKTGGISLTKPISFYRELIDSGEISLNHIEKALRIREIEEKSSSEFLQELVQLEQKDHSIQEDNLNLVRIASIDAKVDFKRLMIESISAFCASYFDNTIATWELQSSSKNLYEAWLSYASIDRSPEIMGMKEYRSYVEQLPVKYMDSIEKIVTQLKISESEIETYLHSVLLDILGWSSYISGIDFNNKNYGGYTKNLEEFLAIRLAWEAYFFERYDKGTIKAAWFKQLHESELQYSEIDEIIEARVILQEAYDLSGQNEIIQAFENHTVVDKQSRPKAQMVFCIDVRSEVYRRHLEEVAPQIETLGFAGFFGFPIEYKEFGQIIGRNQCPVLIPSSTHVCQTSNNPRESEVKAISNEQTKTVLKKFRIGAISSFGYVSPLGVSYLPRILAQSFGFRAKLPIPSKSKTSNKIRLDLSSIPTQQKAEMAKNALTAMGLKGKMAPIVLIAGHGASTTNNPHGSGLECGACGGHAGDVNALTAQEILNDEKVRIALAKMDIEIPSDTVFVACLHNTTTDEISYVNEDLIPSNVRQKLNEIQAQLDKASTRSRVERSERLDISLSKTMNLKSAFLNRSRDWSEVRPEWGLAGCNSFIIAPRKRTKGINLQGKAFMHSYDWQSDEEFKILEAIMTAPMVVTSWINLQYYASTVDKENFGAGNKTLHNVIGGFGVLEGSGGDLKIGLPFQSVSRAQKDEHKPHRLNVIIEAPISAISEILEKNDNLKQLFKNGWMNLLVVNEHGQISWKYDRKGNWGKLLEEKTKMNQKYLQTI
ncbi:MAG: DUF2309 domain-containing protein [Crocinitomicaceae bacterium]